MTKTFYQKYPWVLTWGRWLVYVLFFSLFLIISLYRMDPDFGWHLREGQDFLNGIFPTTDTYNFNAADYSWAAHEWLSDILMAFLYNIGGYVLVAVVWSSLFTLGFWLVGRGKFGPAVFAAFLATLPFIGVRTVVWSVLGLGFLMWFMNHQFKKPRLKLIFIPLIILLWAQLHGSFLIGIVYLIYRAIFVDKSWKIALATVVGGLSTIINPFGYHLWLETLAIIFDGELTWNIGEWHPGIDYWTIMPLFLLWLMSFILNPPKRLGKLKNWRYFIRFDIFLFISSITSRRNYPLFVLSAINPAHNSIEKFYKMTRVTKQGIVFGRVIYTIFIAGLLFVVINYFYPIINNMIEHKTPVVALSEHNGMPNKIIDHLNENPCDGNLFNHYNTGGYLIWKIPDQKVYIDGRMGTTWTRPKDSNLGEAGENYFFTWQLVYSGEKIDKGIFESPSYEFVYTDFAKSKQAEVFDKFNITCAIVNENSKIFEHLKSEDWQTTIANDNGWFLLEEK